MDKEQILEMSRQENRNRDEMEQATFHKAGQRAVAVGGLVCAVIIVLEWLLANRVSLSIWAVYLSMTGTMLLTKYLSLKKPHELVFGIVQLALAAVFLVLHAMQMAG
ncbi:DUF6442 family protein [Slackia heliotrinireducens]|jgi:hypothetical protein|uniref:DUF6442 family protein n=1 Tax=Slackia heliotrinireducens TaxID=84110 RepID=UPI00331636C5